MSDEAKPLTPAEEAQLHAAMSEGAHGALHTPSGVDLSPLPQRPDFFQKAVDFVTMADENGLLEKFVEELEKLEDEDGAADGEASEA